MTLKGIQSRSGSTFSNVVAKLRLLLPYVWPRRDGWLQARVIVCGLLLLLGRVVNVFVPIYSGWIVDALGDGQFCWQLILVFTLLRLVQGDAGASGGLLNTFRTFLWIRVQQYTTRTLSVELYAHVHALSLRWHLSRKTGEVLRVMDRGQTSVSSLLQYIIFRIAPTLVDIIIAVVYFITAFNAWFGLITGLTMAVYLGITYWMTEWRTKFRREMNVRSNASNTRGVDSLLNSETVKYYCAEELEVERYKEAVLAYQESEFLSNATVSLLNFTQNLIIGIGLMAGSLLCAWMVSALGDGTLTVGDFVLFSSYIMQLYQPLNWLGTYYRMIQQSFVDMENMFDLLDEQKEVRDDQDAKQLQPGPGKIELNNVSFHYVPEKPILTDISFSVAPGTTTALVGPSGSGKSTIIRLLFRFYDVTAGKIYFDQQNICRLTQRSLRQSIGVVPQDTVLFNDSIRYNIKYGRLDATDAEIEAAAKAADIHERILSFPDGYETKVGERGLKLSGGEKQRVAIARTLLKAPAFVFLDEATSALDTHTERTIQAALGRVCQGRTSLVVAHRLSTVVNAEQILVLDQGRIVERGTHEQLLKRAGVYSRMWQAQLSSEQAQISSEQESSLNEALAES